MNIKNLALMGFLIIVSLGASYDGTCLLTKISKNSTRQ